MKTNPKYLISGGGTGGHIFPAVSIANALREMQPECKILFVGALGRMEMERVLRSRLQIVGLPMHGFDRKNLWKNVTTLFDLWKSMRQVKRIIREFRPDVAIGVGGYASGAGESGCENGNSRTFARAKRLCRNDQQTASK